MSEREPVSETAVKTESLETFAKEAKLSEQKWVLRTEVKTEQLDAFAKEGILSQDAHAYAMAWLGKERGLEVTWRAFLSYVFLFLGIGLFVAGVIFFFAYNWASMGRFVKFGLLEIAVLGVALVAWQRGLETLGGQAALLMAILLVGPLLAVYGQVYQTGADAYTLFMGWALLVLGWVVVSRLAAAWFVWWVLVNLTAVLYCAQTIQGYAGEYSIVSVLIVLNAIALLVWELLSEERFVWLQTPVRWAPRVLLLLLLFVLSTGVLEVIDGHRRTAESVLVFSLFWTLGYLVGIPLLVWVYTLRRTDLFALVAVALSLVVVSTSFVGRWVKAGMDTFFFLSLLVIVEVAIAGFLLRKVHQYAQSK